MRSSVAWRSGSRARRISCSMRRLSFEHSRPRSPGERAEQWQPSYDDARGEYEDLRAEMVERGVDFAQHEKFLQQRVLLEREVSELQRIDEELSKVEDELRSTHSTLVQAHERRLALRRSQAGVLEEMDADVRLEVLPFRDRRDFEAPCANDL